MAKAAKWANAFLLAALGAVGFFDIGWRVSGGVTSVACRDLSPAAFLATAVESREVGWSCGVAPGVRVGRQPRGLVKVVTLRRRVVALCRLMRFWRQQAELVVWVGVGASPVV